MKNIKKEVYKMDCGRDQKLLEKEVADQVVPVRSMRAELLAKSAPRLA
jgi:hypothetical protein